MSERSKRCLTVFSLIIFLTIGGGIGTAFFLFQDVTTNPQYDQALALFSNKEFAQARANFETFIQGNPNHELVEDAEWYIARSYFEENDFASFNLEANSFIRNYPTHEHADFLRFHQAMVPFKLEDWNGAVEAFTQFLAGNPAGEFKTSAEFLKTRSLFNAERYEEFNQAVALFKVSHPNHPELLFLNHHQGLTYYNRKLWSEAAVEFENFFTSYPNSEFAATSRLLSAISLLNDFKALKYVDYGLAENSRNLGRSRLVEYRQNVSAILADPTLNQDIRDRYEHELLRSYELEEDYAALLTQANSFSEIHQANPEKWALGIFLKGIAIMNHGETDLDGAALTFESIFSRDFSQVKIEGMLGQILLTAAHWRIWCAERKMDANTARLYFEMVKNELPANPVKDKILDQFSHLAAESR